MKGAWAGGLAAILAFAVATSSSAAGLPSTTYVDKGGKYSITIPRTWQLVPRTVAQVNALIVKLKKKQSTVDLANYYKQLIASAAQRQQLGVYRFQAFDWPESLTQPVPIEVSVGIVVGKKAYTVQTLTSAGAVYADALAANKGAKVTVPKAVQLPVGTAELIEAVIPLGQGVSNGVQLYLIPRGKLLYELSFQVEASSLSSATIFTSIAQNFKFTTS